MPYFLGTDIGASKTHIAIADETGRVVGFGQSGPGNHEVVGFPGMHQALTQALRQALAQANLSPDAIAGAGYGVAGYDWPAQEAPCREVLDRLGLSAPYIMVNDAIPGLVAGAQDGWGVAVISGTGCNCRGWDREHKIEGRVTGFGIQMGEGAGASELVYRAMQLVGYSWSKRLPPTALSDIFIRHTGAKDLADLVEGYTQDRYHIPPALAPQIFEAARAGDEVARDLIRWAGCELGGMAVGVIRQLGCEALAFDVVLMGSMFSGGALLIEPMRETIHAVAPQARLVRLEAPPVMGAVLIGMSAAGLEPTPEIRRNLHDTLQIARNGQG